MSDFILNVFPRYYRNGMKYLMPDSQTQMHKM